MTRVYVADAKPQERSALRLVLLDLKMDVVGEAADWETTLAQAPISRTDMLLIDWDLLPDSPNAALDKLRKVCPAALVIILISHLDARQQAARSAGADAFISKGETPERVAERLRAVAASIPTMVQVPADMAIQVPINMSIQGPTDTAITAIQGPTDTAIQGPTDTAIQGPTDTATQAPADPAIPPD